MNNIEAMLNTVSTRLGISPDKLKEALKTGNINMALENMPQKDAEKLKAILGNPETMQKVLSSKQAQEIKKNLDN